MNPIRVARAVGGLLSIVALLTMIGADVLLQGAVIETERVFILLGLISALLGVDIISKKLPLEITVGEKQGSNDE